MTNEAKCGVGLQQAEEICEELNKFSFDQVVDRGSSPTIWSEENRKSIRNSQANGCCTACQNIEGKDCSGVEVDGKKYSMKYLCHGAHSLDFLRAIYKENGDQLFDDVQKNESDWNFAPVLFLLENPSQERKPWQEKQTFGDEWLTIYEKEEGKCPSADWHWIYGGYNEEDLVYPNQFKKNKYGDLIASLIRMFRLGNAYVTDFVKCSMNDGKRFIGTNKYPKQCLDCCNINILQEEVRRLITGSNKLIIFTFGNRVHSLTKKYLLGNRVDSVELVECELPHPASRLTNDCRKRVLLSRIYETLKSNDFACEKAYMEYLSRKE